MRKDTVFLAGASGAIGRRLAPILCSSGWRVVGTTRSSDRVKLLQDLGVEPIVVDVFDAKALRSSVVAVRPQIVIHQLTDLPPALLPDQMPQALRRTARLRVEGTRNLIAATNGLGVKRLIAQSIAFIYADGPHPYRECDPLLPNTDAKWGESAAGIASLEEQVLNAALDGVVLRYGRLYGPGTGFAYPAGSPPVHVDAAAKASELAINNARPGVYNVAEHNDSVSIVKASVILGWDPSWRLTQ